MKFKPLTQERKDFFKKRLEDTPQLLPLRNKLLEIDGLEIVPRPEGDLTKLMGRGRVFDLNVKLKLMRRSGCHENAVKLWMKNKEKNKICTGWGLSDDGLWRQHTWIISGEYIIETTEKRIKYFGVVLDEAESEIFASYNFGF